MLAHMQGLDIQCGYNSGHDDLLQRGCDQLEADTGGPLCTGFYVQYPDPPHTLPHLQWDPVLLIRRSRQRLAHQVLDVNRAALENSRRMCPRASREKSRPPPPVRNAWPSIVSILAAPQQTLTCQNHNNTADCSSSMLKVVSSCIEHVLI